MSTKASHQPDGSPCRVLIGDQWSRMQMTTSIASLEAQMHEMNCSAVRQDSSISEGIDCIKATLHFKSLSEEADDVFQIKSCWTTIPARNIVSFNYNLVQDVLWAEENHSRGTWELGVRLVPRLNLGTCTERNEGCLVKTRWRQHNFDNAPFKRYSMNDAAKKMVSNCNWPSFSVISRRLKDFFLNKAWASQSSDV